MCLMAQILIVDVCHKEMRRKWIFGGKLKKTNSAEGKR